MAEQETDAVRAWLGRVQEALDAAPQMVDDDATAASLNAAETLMLIVRAVLDLADEHAGCCGAVHVDRLRAAVAEALRGEAGR